jgi:2-alkyl-3-oxoalkanoate reductase
MSTSRETRVGLVGAGYVSAYHIRALQTLPHVRIVGIADTSVERAQALAQRFAIPGAFASLSDMGHARPDVVHVLTPPASHARLAVEALEMGCDVFVEKPMAPTVAECDEMIAAATRAGRALSVNHSAKDDPVVVRALELLRRGVCGDVLAVDFYRTSDYPLYAGGRLPAAFRHGGYPFQDMGIHALYLMEALLGPISDIDVRYRSTGKDPNVFFDDWRGTVTCAKGTGAFYLSWSARPIRNELFVHGTDGDMHIDCFLQRCTVRRSLPGPKPIAASISAMAHAAGTVWHVPKNVWRLASGSLRPSPGIHDGVLRFHDALARGTEPPVTMDEGRRMVAWLEPFCRKPTSNAISALRLKESLEPRRILVTGASGLLGRALLDRLRRDGESIRVLVRRRSPELEGLPGVQVVYGDLGDPEAVDRATAGVQLVYHLGATMRGRGWADFDAGTVHGTSNVVHSCLTHKVERLVMSVRSRSWTTPASRRAPLSTRRRRSSPGRRNAAHTHRPRCSPNASSSTRYAARSSGRRPQARPDRRARIRIGVAVRRHRAGGAVDHRRLGRLRLPLVHVSDVVEGLLAAATRPDVCGSIFHLVDSTPVTQRDYITRCQEEANGALRVNYVPRTALLAAGAASRSRGRTAQAKPAADQLPDSVHQRADLRLLRCPAATRVGADLGCVGKPLRDTVSPTCVRRAMVTATSSAVPP